jgi:hypothetical protein
MPKRLWVAFNSCPREAVHARLAAYCQALLRCLPCAQLWGPRWVLHCVSFLAVEDQTAEAQYATSSPPCPLVSSALQVGAAACVVVEQCWGPCLECPPVLQLRRSMYLEPSPLLFSWSPDVATCTKPVAVSVTVTLLIGQSASSPCPPSDATP